MDEGRRKKEEEDVEHDMYYEHRYKPIGFVNAGVM
jgi:hypothetical protein